MVRILAVLVLLASAPSIASDDYWKIFRYDRAETGYEAHIYAKKDGTELIVKSKGETICSDTIKKGTYVKIYEETFDYYRTYRK